MTKVIATIPVECDLSQESYEDILDAAVYGINYWTDWASIGTETEDSIDVVLRFKPSDSDASLQITKQDIETVIATELANPESKLAWEEKLILFFALEEDDAGEIDSTLADKLVQLTFFKSMVYA